MHSKSLLLLLGFIFLSAILPQSTRAAPPPDPDLEWLTPEERQWLRDHPVVRAANQKDWAPMDFLGDGQPRGYSIDLIKLLEKKLGIRVEFSSGHSWQELQELLRKRQIDILPAAIKNDRSAKHTNYTTPYYKQGYVLISRHADPIRKPEQLSGKSLALAGAWTINENVLKSALHGDHHRVERDSPENQLLAVNNHEADAAILSRPMADYYLNALFLPNLVVSHTFEDVNDPGIAIGIRSDWPLLRDILDKALDRTTPEEKHALAAAWLQVDDPSDTHANTPAAEQEPTSQAWLTTEERQWLKDHPVIRIANEEDWAPMDFVVDGKPQGYSIDLMRLIEERLGINFAFINGYSWKELVELLRKRELDVLPVAGVNEERKKFALFTDFYFNMSYVLVTRDDNPIRAPEDFVGKTLVLQKGAMMNKTLPANPHYAGYKIITRAAIEDSLMAVRSGEADAAVMSFANAGYALKTLYFPNLAISYTLTGMNDNGLAAAVRSDWPLLRDILDKTIAQISPAELKALETRWFHIGASAEEGQQPGGTPSETTESSPRWAAPTSANGTGVIDLTREQRQYLSDLGVLRLCIDPDWRPFEWLDARSEHQGLSADFVDIFARRIGIKFNLVPTASWAESLERVKNRDCDVLPLAMETVDRKAYLDFTIPYVFSPLVAVTRNDTDIPENLDQWTGQPVGIIDSYSFAEILKDQYPSLILVPVKSTADAYRKVASGELAAFFTDRISASYQLLTGDMSQDLKIGRQFPWDWTLSMGVRNDQPELLAILDSAVSSLGVQEKKKILDKWLAIRLEKETDYALIWRILAIALLAAAVIIAWVMYLVRLNRRIRNLNDGLNASLDESHRAKMALETANGELEDANRELRVANQNILDSLRYASRIQRAVLSNSADVAKAIPDHFTLWEPLNIVGGDVYWFQQWGNGYLVILADCTGHGVPGAFMTLITNGALRQALNSTAPGDCGGLMAEAHRLIKSGLGQETVEKGASDDGLEMGVVYLPFSQTDHVIYSGARFSLFVVDPPGRPSDRTTGCRVRELKGDRMGIGYRRIPWQIEFTNHMVPISADTGLIMASDGLIDQIGGPKRRSFGKKRLVGLLETLGGEPMPRIGVEIAEQLRLYQGNESRRDDLSAIGLRSPLR